jgi:hypothetical protein
MLHHTPLAKLGTNNGSKGPQMSFSASKHSRTGYTRLENMVDLEKRLVRKLGKQITNFMTMDMANERRE